MRYSPSHKQKTRERVLRVAAKAIRAKGPKGVGVAYVMRGAGLTHGGFYAHFASKDAMVAAAIGRMFDEGFARWCDATEGRAHADGLRAFINGYLSRTHRDARAAGCPIAALLAESPRFTASCRRAFAAGMRRLIDALASHLDALGYRDAQAHATSLLSELVGALALARAEPDRTRSDAMLAASRRHIRHRLALEESR